MVSMLCGAGHSVVHLVRLAVFPVPCGTMERLISFLSNALHPVVHRVYLSLGVAEEKARNPRMARVGNCTREIYRFLQSQVPCTLEWNPGGHFVTSRGVLRRPWTGSAGDVKWILPGKASK